MRDDVDVLGLSQSRTDRRVPVEDFQYPVGQVCSQQLGEPPAGAGTPLAGLVHHGVSCRERGAQQAGGHRDRIVPRGQHRDHATRLRNHQICCAPRTLQAVAAVKRPELGVLHERTCAGLDAADRVVFELAGLALVEFGQLVSSGPDSGGRTTQCGGTLGRRRVGPTCRGRACSHDGLLTGRGVGDRHPGDGFAGAGIVNSELHGLRHG